MSIVGAFLLSAYEQVFIGERTNSARRGKKKEQVERKQIWREIE